MAEYIERETTLDALRKAHNPNTARMAISFAAVNSVPAADVAPVSHGRWIQKEKCYPEIEKQMDFRFECSECGFSDIHNATLDVPYCWHCGAKMDKEEDNG